MTQPAFAPPFGREAQAPLVVPGITGVAQSLGPAPTPMSQPAPATAMGDFRAAQQILMNEVA